MWRGGSNYVVGIDNITNTRHHDEYGKKIDTAQTRVGPRLRGARKAI